MTDRGSLFEAGGQSEDPDLGSTAVFVCPSSVRLASWWARGRRAGGRRQAAGREGTGAAGPGPEQRAGLVQLPFLRLPPSLPQPLSPLSLNPRPISYCLNCTPCFAAF